MFVMLKVPVEIFFFAFKVPNEFKSFTDIELKKTKSWKRLILTHT